MSANPKIWLEAARPKTLPAAVMPVMVGTALASVHHATDFTRAAICLVFALLVQIGTNFANDYYDFVQGADTAARVGPRRAVAAGLVTPRQMLIATWLVLGVAFAVGLLLVRECGWVLLPVGVISIVCAIAYTGGPFPLGYYGLGEVFVFIFFGLVAVTGTFYVQAGSVSAAAWWMSVPVGLIITAILVVNNLRDLENDCQAGKHTLAVRLGIRGTRMEYMSCMAIAYLLLPALVILNIVPMFSLLAWLSIPFAWKTMRVVFTQEGRPLNAALAGTGQIALVYSVLFWVGISLAK